MNISSIGHFSSICFLSFISLITFSNAAQLVVKVESESEDGNIGCSVFSDSKGFPMDSSEAIQKFKSNSAKGTEFIFSNLKSGKYAVSVMNDKNGNKILDRNFICVPKEEWGVSNNIRPSMRPPKFEEAAFEFDDKVDLTINIKIQK